MLVSDCCLKLYLNLMLVANSGVFLRIANGVCNNAASKKILYCMQCPFCRHDYISRLGLKLHVGKFPFIELWFSSSLMVKLPNSSSCGYRYNRESCL